MSPISLRLPGHTEIEKASMEDEGWIMLKSDQTDIYTT
jgi:hypothetical protein